MGNFLNFSLQLWFCTKLMNLQEHFLALELNAPLPPFTMFHETEFHEPKLFRFATAVSCHHVCFEDQPQYGGTIPGHRLDPDLQ